MNNIYLTGFMGSGKSTVGKELSMKLSRPLLDMDKMIEDKAGCSIKEIFNNQGEAYFRQLETDVLKDIQQMSHQVVSTGGGAVLKEENRLSMQAGGKVVFLHASVEHLMKHLKNDKNRPLLQVEDPEAAIVEMLAKRESHYLSAANLIIQATGKTIMEIVDEIISML